MAAGPPMATFTEKVFFWFGTLVARYPHPFIVFPLLLTTFSLVGIKNFHLEEDYWHLYAPDKALSRKEESVLQPFLRLSGYGYRKIRVMVTSPHGDSLLNSNSLREIDLFNGFVEQNMSWHFGNKNYRYDDLCGALCPDKNAHLIRMLNVSVSEPDNPNFALSYPYAQAMRHDLFLGYSVGQVDINSEGKLDNARLIILHYGSHSHDKMWQEISRQFEHKIRLFCKQFSMNARLQFEPFSDALDLEEQTHVALTTLPYLAVTIFLLGTFAITTMTSLPLPVSQHWEALIGIVSPGMACVTSFGLLWLCGYPYSNILTVVPFLVLVIGIDDAFLIFAAWRQTDPGETAEFRLGTALAKAGTSITITSMTDILCFAIGTFSGMPVVALFGTFTAVALAIDFAYQITFFAAVVAVGGRKEREFWRKNDKNLSVESKSLFTSLNFDFLRKAKVGQYGPKAILTITITKLDNETCSDSSSIEKVPPMDFEQFIRTFMKYPLARISVFGLYFLHFLLSLHLCSRVNTEFSLPKLYLESSPLSPITKSYENFAFGESYVVHFVSETLPDFRDRTTRTRFLDMIKDLESIPGFSAGPKSTRIWMRAYDNYADFYKPHDAWTSHNILTMLPALGQHLHCFRTLNNTIKQFSWTISYSNMTTYADLTTLLRVRRNILANYSQYFSLYSHHPLDFLSDIAQSLPPKVMQTAGTAVLLMALLVLAFVRNFWATYWVIFTLFSITVGTIGYLNLWNVSIDGISLIAILMSVGVSVDYSAHVCYHFFTENHSDEPFSESREEQVYGRLLNTYKVVGWPILQAIMSTVLGMIPLILVQSYIVQVFWKTVLLVNFLGFFHALVLLPCAFVTFSIGKNENFDCFFSRH